MLRAVGGSLKVQKCCPKPNFTVKKVRLNSNGSRTLDFIRTYKSYPIMLKPATPKTNIKEPQSDLELDEKEAESLFKVFAPPPEVIIPKEMEGNPELQRKIHLAEIMSAIQQENADNPVVIDTKTKCSWVSYMIIVTGKSKRHMRAIGDRLVKEFKFRIKVQNGLNAHVEGGEDSEDWMCVDAGDFLVHIMSEKGRNFYNLERLWAMKHTTQGPSDELELRDLEESRKEIPETLV